MRQSKMRQSKRKRPPKRSDHRIMVEDGISKAEVHATMAAAWEELSRDFFADLPKKQREDAKFIFYNGVRAAANLMIYCAGQQEFEKAADQITTECMAYQTEAMVVLEERKKLIEAVFDENAKPS